jgi:large subunit ribosomal protein L9
MKVILAQTVKGLGAAGTVKDVADGYARNYLIPRGLARPATEGVQKEVEIQKKAAAKREKRLLTEAEDFAAELSKLELTFKAKAGEGDRLYGSITTADIAEQITQRLHTELDKRKIVLEDPIRELGAHKVTVKLMGSVTAEVTVIVERAAD